MIDEYQAKQVKDCCVPCPRVSCSACSLLFLERSYCALSLELDKSHESMCRHSSQEQFSHHPQQQQQQQLQGLSVLGRDRLSLARPAAARAPTAAFPELLRRGMSDDEVETLTRFQFKYGCLHGVFGTPEVFVGGVLADGLDGEATFQDWQDLLEPLVGGTPARLKLDGRGTHGVA